MKSDTPRHIIFVGGFVFRNGRILLGQRGPEEKHLPGYWAAPGGKIEIEAVDTWNILQKTVAAEVLEETGVVVSEDMQLLSNNSFTRTDGSAVIGISFVCQWLSGEAEALEDTSAVAWVSLLDLAKYQIDPNTLTTIHKAFNTYNI
jgi:8-oxo-dGTP diphosphatase